MQLLMQRLPIRLRLPETVSGAIFSRKPEVTAAIWMLKQVQHDGVN